MTIDAGITWLQTQLRTLPAMRAPALPPETIVDFPVAIVYEGAGEWTTEAADQYQYLGALIIDMPIPGVDLQAGIKQLRPFFEAVPRLLLADTSLGGAVSTFRTLAFSGLIPLVPEEAGQPALLGYRWTLQNVKLRIP